ncbi:MAG: FHA domain-containing protein [Actinomycetota bacterium]|nr:FHA domain-containing protein [Actinomycetota bacterium]
MPEIAYIILRYVFLILLIAFVLAVSWVIYREMSPARGASRGERILKQRRQRSRKASLVVSGSSSRRKAPVFELGDEMLVGRAGECGISIEDEFASNLHAKIYQQEGRYYVEDLGSTNGTYVNGRRITYPTELRPGDLVKVGRTVLEFRR